MKIRFFGRLISLILVVCVAISAVAIIAEAGAAPQMSKIKAAWYFLDGIENIKKDSKEFSFTSKVNGKKIPFSITFPVEGGFRVHTDIKGFFEPSDVEKINYTEKDKMITITSENSTKIVFDYSNKSWEINAYNSNGKKVYTLSQRQLRFGFLDNEIVKVRVDGSISTGEYMTGLGERYSAVALNGKTYPLWNDDNWSNGDESYVNVPFMHSSKGYSIFINSTYGAEADIGNTISKMYSFSFNGPILDIFLWAKQPLDSIDSYTALTGRPFTAPKWSFGYWAGGSGAYWKSEVANNKTPADLVKEVIEGYKELGTMPVALYGEADPSNTKSVYDYLNDNNVYMIGWNHPGATWDIKNFNISILRELCPGISDALLPGIRQKNNPLKFFGDWIWGDYTNPNAITLIKNKMKDPWSWGIMGAMVDYGEYADEASYFYNGKTGDEMHNLHAYYYNKATYEAWKEGSKGDFILFARSGCAGSQHYAASFGGDQASNFVGLEQAIKGGLSISSSGYSVWGSDIGGLGSIPTDDAYMRWLQFATFSPLMRAHGNNRNPWAHGEAGIQNFTEMYWLRENLIDLLYSANIQSGKNGRPMMQSMAIAYPEDTSLVDEMQYMLCNELLVCPVYTADAYRREIIFPEDKWVSLWDDTIINGGEKVLVEAPYNRIPVYIRSGSVIPVQVSSKTLSLMDSSASGKTEALIFTPAVNKRELNYWKDEKTEVKFTSEKTAKDTYTVTSSGKGNAKVIIAYATTAKSVNVDGTYLKELSAVPANGEIGYYVDKTNGRTTISLNSDKWKKITITNGVGTYKDLAKDKEIVSNIKSGKPQNVLDADPKTTWSISNRIGAEVYIDLGESKNISQVALKWTQSNASEYTIEYSNDADSPSNWKTIKTVKNSLGGSELVSFETVKARYIKLSGIRKAKTTNAELHSFEVYGEDLEYISYEDVKTNVDTGVDTDSKVNINTNIDTDVDFNTDFDTDYDNDFGYDFDTDLNVDLDTDTDVDTDIDEDIDVDVDSKENKEKKNSVKEEEKMPSIVVILWISLICAIVIATVSVILIAVLKNKRDAKKV